MNDHDLDALNSIFTFRDAYYVVAECLVRAREDLDDPGLSEGDRNYLEGRAEALEDIIHDLSSEPAVLSLGDAYTDRAGT